MKTYNIPAEKVQPHATAYVNDVNGNSAVKYKPYYLTPNGYNNENCTSVVSDGLRAGGLNTYVPAVPWLMNEALWEMSLFNDNYTNVTEIVKEDLYIQTITLPEVTITPNAPTK